MGGCLVVNGDLFSIQRKIQIGTNRFWQGVWPYAPTVGEQDSLIKIEVSSQ